MVQYTLAQSPEVVIAVPGKDSPKAREKAMAQLVEMMDAGQLEAELEDGFSPQQFIEVKELPMPTANEAEDAITQAVQVLNNLATLKVKMQELRAEAMKVRSQVDILFTEEPVSEEEISSLREGFKVLKNFAQYNLRYQEAKSQAHNAREVLDKALQSTDTSKPEPDPLKPNPASAKK
jgi:hypothetical protein